LFDKALEYIILIIMTVFYTPNIVKKKIMIVENIVLVLGTTIHFNLQTIPSLFVIGQKDRNN